MAASVSRFSPADFGEDDPSYGSPSDSVGPLAGPGQSPADIPGDCPANLTETLRIVLPPDREESSVENRADAVRRNARMAVSQQTFARTPLSETLLHCDASDIHAVGLSVNRVEEEGPRSVIERLKTSGVSVSSLNWIAGFTGYAGYRLTDTMSEAAATIRLAAALDARCVTVITGPQDGHILSHIRGTFVESMQELAEYAAFFGVDLAIMPMTRRHAMKWTFLTSLPAAIDIVRQIDSPAVGLAINTRFTGETADVTSLRHDLVDAAPLTKLVRLPMEAFSDDRGYRVEQEGVSNVAVAAELDAAGYRGYYEMSAWTGPAVQTDAYKRTLRVVSELSLDARPDRPARPGHTATV